MISRWFDPSAPFVLEAGVGLLLLIVLVDALVTRSRGRRAGWISLVVITALFGASMGAAPGGEAFSGAYVTDLFGLLLKRVFLGASALGLLAVLAADRGAFERRATEFHVAFLASLLGMLVLASARDMILLFVAFELMSIPLYFLTGFQKGSDTGPEAALKFFLVGTVSSAVMLYGLSFMFGATGTTDIRAVAGAVAAGHPWMTLGTALVLAGLGFKIAAVPFHMWVPDTYEAAATPFVAWLSIAPKAAGFVVIVRLFLEGTTGPHAWVPAIAMLAAVTIVAGNLMAIPQRNIKRLLAYSGIAHIGYLLLAVAAASANGVAMLTFYLVAYLFGNMGAFFVVQVVARSEGSDEVDAYRGLAQRSPLLALAMLVFLLSLGGIPFVAGFWAKLYVFMAAAEQGMYGLVFLGAVLTVVALYYYLLIARRMYIDPPANPAPVPVPATLMVAILTCAAGVVVMGLYPEPWVSVALTAARVLF